MWRRVNLLALFCLIGIGTWDHVSAGDSPASSADDRRPGQGDCCDSPEFPPGSSDEPQRDSSDRPAATDRAGRRPDDSQPDRDDDNGEFEDEESGVQSYALESYPEEIAARLELRDRQVKQAVEETGAPEAVATIGKLWRRSPITVAFLGGDATLHRRIAEAAAEWSQHGAIQFDFGSRDGRTAYRTWSRRDRRFAADIRISFDDIGYYSLVGTDSRDPAIVNPHEASMNLSGFDNRLPADWRATVLHEFGHALGLQHEHQHPRNPCDFRFNDDSGYRLTRDSLGQFIPDSRGRRPGLYTLLGGPPNNWSRAKVDHNLRDLSSSRMLFDSGPFDRNSIMKYHFPAWMFQSGDGSHCASPPNARLSRGDQASIARAYPNNREARQELEVASQQYQELVAPLREVALPQNVRAVETTTANRPQMEAVHSTTASDLAERLRRIRPRTSNFSNLESSAAAGQELELATSEEISPEREQLERVIEDPNFLPAEFVVTGASRQNFVGRIAFKTTYQHPQGGTFFPDDGWGTGFLVAPSILMTNNHVLENANFASTKVKLQFNYQRRLTDGVLGDTDTFDLDGNNFFYTNPALDFTLVRVKPKLSQSPGGVATSQPPGARWGHYQLADSLAVGEDTYFERMSLNIVQHPAGRPKELAIHENFLQSPLLPNHLRYTTDTEGGSSGSPVFDNRWVLVGLHHSAGERNPDGTWKDNQGVRIDRIIQNIIASTDIPASVKAELGVQ